MRYSIFIKCIAIILCLTLPVLNSYVFADYVNPDEIISLSTDTEWMFDAAKSGVEAGAESVTKEMLTNVGKAIVESYSPQLAEILFGQDDSLEEHTRRIINEVRLSHSDLAERHRILLDEVMDQYRVNIIGDFLNASDLMDSWLASDDIMSQAESSTAILDAFEILNGVKRTIEEYIKAGSTPQIQYKRLQLLPLHIAATRLALTASGYYWWTVAISVAFNRSPYGADITQFDHWVSSLTESDIERIRNDNPQFERYRNTVYGNLMVFYSNLSEQDSVADYVEDIFTPAVSHMNTFDGNINMYDNPDIVTDRDNWQVDGGSYTTLDGQRWYYYVNIPQAQCLEGYAFYWLSQTSYVPWSELASSPAGSECNRFWIVDLYSYSSGTRDGYLASFDGYEALFTDPVEIYEVHKKLIHGDLVRAIYGPVSLVLDSLYSERFDGTRPKNKWDLLLTKYEQIVNLLGVGASRHIVQGLSINTDSIWCTHDTGELHLGDFNGDGRIDLMCKDPGGIAIDYANQYGNFDWHDWWKSTNWCTHDTAELYLGDFNGDGRTDLMCKDPGSIIIDYADQQGHFNWHDWWIFTNWCTHDTAELYLGDFNGDGRTDLMCKDPGSIIIDYADQQGHFDWHDWWKSTDWCTHDTAELYLGDFNGDGQTDLMCKDPGSIIIDYADQNGHFDWHDWWKFTNWCTHDTAELYLGDFNGDGRTDLMCKDPGSIIIDYADQQGHFDWHDDVFSSFCNESYTTLYFGNFEGYGAEDLLCKSVSYGNKWSAIFYK